MNDFFRSTLKIALAIIISVSVLALLGWLAWTGSQSWQREAAKQYEVLRDWSVDLTAPLEMDLRAKTKVVEGRLYIAAAIDGYPAYLSHPMLAAKNQAAHLTLQFLDPDGFKVFEKATTISEWASVVDTTGAKTGLSSQFDDFVSVEDYKRFSSLTVQWTVNTVIPELPTSPEASAPEVADHCAPKLTKAERLRRLAQHGTVRETGFGEYSVGLRTLNIMDDGSLIYCR
jgi:hypothetical protein